MGNARFIKVPTFDIYDEETDTWADPEDWWLEGELIYQSKKIGEDVVVLSKEVDGRLRECLLCNSTENPFVPSEELHQRRLLPGSRVHIEQMNMRVNDLNRNGHSLNLVSGQDR